MSELEYQKLILPNYVNSREVFAGLTVSDMVIAAVLSPLNVMLLGKTGTGKSQLARDIYNYYFGNEQICKNRIKNRFTSEQVENN